MHVKRNKRSTILRLCSLWWISHEDSLLHKRDNCSWMLGEPIFVSCKDLFNGIIEWRMMPLLPILLVANGEAMLVDVHIKQQWCDIATIRRRTICMSEKCLDSTGFYPCTAWNTAKCVSASTNCCCLLRIAAYCWASSSVSKNSSMEGDAYFHILMTTYCLMR